MQTRDDEALLKEVAELLEKCSDDIYEELTARRTHTTTRLQTFRRARITIAKCDPQWQFIQAEVDRLTVEVFYLNRHIQTLLKLKYETFKPFYLSDMGIYPS